MNIGQPVGGWTLSDASTSRCVETTGGTSGGGHVLAPLLTSEESNLVDQLEVARILAKATGVPLRVTAPISNDRPSSTSLSNPPEDDAGLHAWATEQVSSASGSEPTGLLDVHRLTRSVRNTIEATDVETLVLPGDTPASLLAGDASQRIAAHADCNVVVVNGKPGIDSLPSVLLPITGGPHSGLAVDVARRIATATGAWVDVLHVVETDASERRHERANAYVDAAERRLGLPEQTSSWILEASDPIDAITRQSDYYPLTILGAPTTGRLQRFVAGSTNESIRSNADSVVLSVYNNAGTPALEGPTLDEG